MKWIKKFKSKSQSNLGLYDKKDVNINYNSEE